MLRRDILAAAPLGVLAAISGGCGQSSTGAGSARETPASQAAAGQQGNGRKLAAFGLQLSTITPLLMADFEGTLEKVAAIGYRQVEFSALGFLGRPVERVVELLAANNLSAPVGRISPKLPDDFATMKREQQMAAFRTYSGPDHLLDNVRHGLQACQVLDQKHLVLPALMPDNFSSLAAVEQSIALLQQAGELCAAAGVQFGYHNHDWEFKAVDGVIPYDLMLERIEPELMTGQLDVYWVTKGGRDPLQYLQSFSGRFPSCHLKDMSETGDFEDVGHGTIDFPQFTAAAMAAGTAYYFVERDNPPQPMTTARRAYAFLEQMTF